jgi:hypothetical protein
MESKQCLLSSSLENGSQLCYTLTEGWRCCARDGYGTARNFICCSQLSAILLLIYVLNSILCINLDPQYQSSSTLHFRGNYGCEPPKWSEVLHRNVAVSSGRALLLWVATRMDSQCVICSTLTCTCVNRDGAVGIATSYWMDDRGVGVRVPVG